MIVLLDLRSSEQKYATPNHKLRSQECRILYSLSDKFHIVIVNFIAATNKFFENSELTLLMKIKLILKITSMGQINEYHFHIFLHFNPIECLLVSKIKKGTRYLGGRQIE